DQLLAFFPGEAGVFGRLDGPDGDRVDPALVDDVADLALEGGEIDPIVIIERRQAGADDAAQSLHRLSSRSLSPSPRIGGGVGVGALKNNATATISRTRAWPGRSTATAPRCAMSRCRMAASHSGTSSGSQRRSRRRRRAVTSCA